MAEEKKNAKAAEKQAEVRAEKAVEEVEVTVRDGRYAGLTKRNEDYMYHLGKALDKKNYDQEKKEKALTEMYLELKEKQRQGIVATKLYGTVMALDNGLIMFIMFCILYAVMGFFSKNQPDMNGGWITLIATSAIAGCGLAFFYRMMADNSKTKSKKKKWTRGILVTLELIAIWMIAFGIIAFIPASINRTMSPIVYAILGVAGYFVRRYLKGKLHFQNMAF